MARLSKPALFERVLGGLSAGGWSFLIVKRTHPYELLIYRDNESYRSRVYIWNITPGGGQRLEMYGEYRIQITGVPSFSTSGVQRTLILGWWDDISVFAGWDVSKHLRLGKSPSLQISEDAMARAGINRVATYRKDNDEIALAFQPSFLGDYVSQLPALHEIGESNKDLAVLDAVIADPEKSEKTIEEGGTGKRQRVLKQFAQQLRDGSFKDRVLTAYSRTCAMCGVQLRVIDAAHIVPAKDVDNDATSNGLALCGTHHRAFDRALVTVQPDYSVAFNPLNFAALQLVGLDGGWDPFRAALRPQIILPPDRRDHPSPARIREANTLRGWTAFEAP